MPNTTLPVPNPTTPFWRKPPHELDALRTTPSLPTTSDIVIIGAGYSGISIAYHLLKLKQEEEDKSRYRPQHENKHQDTSPPPTTTTKPHITILEARQLCSGATGRNGGHLRPDLYGHISTCISRYGVEAGAEVAGFELGHVDVFRELLDGIGIQCDFRTTTNLNVFRVGDEEGVRRARGLYESLVRLRREEGEGEKGKGLLGFIDDIEWLEGCEAERVSGVKGTKACLSTPAATIWPYKFVLGLVEKIVNNINVNIQTSTPVSSVTSASASLSTGTTPTHTIHTSRGQINTPKIIYATNAYTPGLLPEYSSNIIPCRGLCTHITTPPPPVSPTGENTLPPPIHHSYLINTEDGKGSSYLISRPDGSIIVGGAQYTFESNRKQWYNVVDDSTLIEPVKDYYDGYMQRTFKGWERSGAYVKEVWTGIMGYSYDSAPHVGPIPKKQNQYICAGFNGHGMPVIFLVAKELAEMIHTGKKFGEVNLPRVFETSLKRIEAARNGPEGGDIFGDC